MIAAGDARISADRLERALDRIRPLVLGHGGSIEIVEVDGGTVTVKLTGACEACPNIAMTYVGPVRTFSWKSQASTRSSAAGCMPRNARSTASRKVSARAPSTDGRAVPVPGRKQVSTAKGLRSWKRRRDPARSRTCPITE